MDYNECKRELDETRRKYSLLKNELKTTTAELDMMVSEHAKEEGRYRQQVNEAREIETQRHVDRCCRAYKDALELAEKKISRLNSQHEKNLSEISAEKIMNSENQDKEYYDETKKALDTLADNLAETIGPRFRDELMSQLNSQKIKIEAKDLPSFIIYFDSLNRKFGQSQKRKRPDIWNLVKKSTDGITLERLKENPINIALAVAVLGVGVLLFAEIVLPFYVVALCTVLIWNLRKHYKMYEIMIAMKAVKDNVGVIESLLRQQAERKAEQQKKKENALYDKCFSSYMAEREDARSRLERAEAKARESFFFNEDAMSTTRRAELASMQNRIWTLKEKKVSLEHDIQRIMRRNEQQEKNLARIAGDIPKEYLNPEKVGADFIFNPKFIFDVENNRPEFFIHPESSCLFIYRDYEDVVSFIKLINLQLRVRFSPNAFKVELYDRKYGGISFQPFVAEGFPQLFKIYSNSEEITKAFKDMDELVTKRIRLILASSDGIKAYNELMVSSESVPENYVFSFMMDPEQADVQNEAFLRAYRTGGNLGIFFHAFIQEKVFYDLGDNARTLANEAGKCFILQNGKYNQRAKNYILETMIQKKDKTSLPKL